MKKLMAIAVMFLLISGCGEDKANKRHSYRQKNTQENEQECQADVIRVRWKMLSGNSYIYFTLVEIDGHKYISATRGYDSLALQHAASCPCKQDK